MEKLTEGTDSEEEDVLKGNEEGEGRGHCQRRSCRQDWQDETSQEVNGTGSNFLSRHAVYSTNCSSEKVMPKPAAVMFDKPLNDYAFMMLITTFICFMLVRLRCWLPKRKKLRGDSRETGFLQEKDDSIEILTKSKIKKAQNKKGSLSKKGISPKKGTSLWGNGRKPKRLKEPFKVKNVPRQNKNRLTLRLSHPSPLKNAGI